MAGSCAARWVRDPGASAPGASGPGAAAEPAAIDVASHAAQIADLLAAIEGGREPAVDGEAGRDALEIVCAVYESARTGRTVRLTGTVGSAGSGVDDPAGLAACGGGPEPPGPHDRHAQRVRRRDLARP